MRHRLLDVQGSRPRLYWVALGATLLFTPLHLGAQLGASSPSSSALTRPVQVPLSGRQGTNGSVAITQQPAGGGDSGVQTINSTVQVTGSFAGSILGNPLPNGVTAELTIDEAIRRGLRYNLGVKAASRSAQQASATQSSVRSALLPNISAQLSDNVNKISLITTGFDASSFPSIGQFFPTDVGPFHYYSAQANVSQSLLDMVALENYQTSKLQTEAAKLGTQDAREQIALAVAGSYLRVLSAIAAVNTEMAEVKYSQGVYDQSLAQEVAGAKPHVETNRNLVQLQTEQQRLTADQATLIKVKMILAREIGLSIDQDFTVREALSPDTTAAISLAEAYQRAATARNDVHAAEVQVRVAEDARKAAGAQYLPTLKLQGFYGLQGVNPNSGTSVYNGSISLNVPIFSGGQIRSDERQSDAALNQRRSELSDLREQVRFEVRTAWLDLDVAAKQVAVAESNRRLAAQTLQQSTDRFFAGATTSVEVVQSEQAVASAENDYIGSLFSLNLARISLARSMGEAEKDIPLILKGAQ
jgi:outer membrane protein TolC